MQSDKKSKGRISQITSVASNCQGKKDQGTPIRVKLVVTRGKGQIHKGSGCKPSTKAGAMHSSCSVASFAMALVTSLNFLLAGIWILGQKCFLASFDEVSPSALEAQSTTPPTLLLSAPKAPVKSMVPKYFVDSPTVTVSST